MGYGSGVNWQQVASLMVVGVTAGIHSAGAATVRIQVDLGTLGGANSYPVAIDNAGHPPAQEMIQAKGKAARDPQVPRGWPCWKPKALSLSTASAVDTIGRFLSSSSAATSSK